MNTKNTQAAHRMFEKAMEDYQMLLRYRVDFNIEYTRGPFCRTMQEACEKFIKSVLLYRTGQHPFSHLLDQLLDLANTAGPPEAAFALDARQHNILTVLQGYAGERRYTNAHGIPSEGEMNAYFALTQALHVWAENAIGPPPSEPAWWNINLLL